MANTYYCLITAVGRAKLAAAIASGEKIELTEIVVGDGGGNPVTPNDAQTALVRETYRTNTSRLAVADSNANRLIAEGIVPASAGGFVLRESGVIDADGDLFAVGNFPATYKPDAAEGATQDIIVRMVIEFSGTDNVSLQVNTAVVIASRQWVIDNFLSAPGGTTGQMMRKRSNADGDVEWFNLDIEGLNIQFDTYEEVQELVDEQTIINWATISTTNAGYYVDRQRLRPGDDYTVTGPAQITLTPSFVATVAAGTKIHGVQNDQAGGIPAASATVQGLVELATSEEAKTGTDNTRAVTPAGLAATLQDKGYLRSSQNLQDLGNVTQALKNLGIFDYIPKAMCLYSASPEDTGHAYYIYQILPNSAEMRLSGVTTIPTSDPKQVASPAFSTGNVISGTRVTGNGPGSISDAVVTRTASGYGFGPDAFYISVTPSSVLRQGYFRIPLQRIIKGKNVKAVVRKAQGLTWVNFFAGAMAASKTQYVVQGAAWARGSTVTPIVNLDGTQVTPINNMRAAIRIEAYETIITGNNQGSDPALVPIHVYEVE